MASIPVFILADKDREPDYAPVFILADKDREPDYAWYFK